MQQYADLKKLPVSFLRELGLSDIKYLKQDAVRIPYYATTGEEAAVQFRLALHGSNKFKWRTGDKPCLYGLSHDYKSSGQVFLCEGPSDWQTLHFNGFPALGIPGANSWREDRDAPHLEGIGTIYVVIEPDSGGVAVQKWLATSRIRDRVKLLTQGELKDPSELFLHDPDNFKANLREAMAKAVSWSDLIDQETAIRKAKAWAICRTLAQEKDILSKFYESVKQLGVAGEKKNTKLLYLTVNGRHQDRPPSAIVKGTSAGGKSFLVEQVLRYFPASAYYALTSLSDHGLAYVEESLAHRYLILFEAAGISTDFANYLLRTLLSEGKIRYQTVQKTPEGMKPKLIELDGPTGVIITTTSIRLHPENETRLLSIEISDTPEQTEAILLVLSEGKKEIDLTQWQALQEWIDLSEQRVEIPYAKDLARLIPPVAVGLRRDFTQILTPIKSHTILQQASREKAPGGQLWRRRYPKRSERPLRLLPKSLKMGSLEQHCNS